MADPMSLKRIEDQAVPCPGCGAEMKRRSGRGGRLFWACSDPRRCDGDGRGAADPWCPACGKAMEAHQGRMGLHRDRPVWTCAACVEFSGPASSNLGPPLAPVRLPNSGRLHEKAQVSGARKSDSEGLRFLPVEWRARKVPSGFLCEFAAVAAVPEFAVPDDRQLARALRQAVPGDCVLFSADRDRTSGDSDSYAAGLFLTKILQRGRAPMPTLSVEREAVRAHDLLATVEDLGEDGYSATLGWRPRETGRSCVSAEGAAGVLAERRQFVVDREFEAVADDSLFDSPLEYWFLADWVPRYLGPKAGHWFTPQAPLDTILEAAGIELESRRDSRSGFRRIDFLFHHPGGPPLAIELDGAEHESAALVDRDRDLALQRAGIETVRVGVSDLAAGDGPALQRIRRHCEGAFEALASTAKADEPIVSAVGDCVAAARVQFALARALQYGWLQGGGEWTVQLHGAGRVQAAAVVDALQLLASFDDIFACSTVPEQCNVRYGDVEESWVRSGSGKWHQGQLAAGARGPVQDLVVRLEVDTGPYAELSRNDGADLIIRSAFVPVPLRVTTDVDRGTARRRRKLSAVNEDAATRALTTVLQHLFRKREFRHRQVDAILKLLDQDDCIVLLPTGAGKSLIYQLAGMMMPGVTLVVDPTIALMEDQVEGLEASGFDRATSVSSRTQRARIADLHLRIGRGEYQFLFLSPERLQIPRFRRTISSLTNSAQVNLVVVDEAHCVSEWGHDFRPAYLHLADRLRELGKSDSDDAPPPLLGLTGTASRAVLRDMLVELSVDTVLRPESFDRAEIEFDVRRVRGGSSGRSHKALQGVLSALPREFRIMSGADFFAARGRRTKSGIVFVPHVNGKFGLSEVGDLVARETGGQVALYGGANERNAALFKENKASVMVATKAFGMGIDKENVRWTVHLGMPGSIESFYQEAGRAGRTREKARCTVVYSELDRERNDDLLDPGIEFEEAKRRYDTTQGGDWWRQADDVTRALFFHFNAFEGSASEVDSARAVLRRAGDLAQSERVELPMDEEGRTEKAVCVLRRVGVVREYDVEYGSKRIVAHFEAFDAERSRRKLGKYLAAADPARTEILKRKAEAIVGPNNQAHALALARLLIEFTYEQVERGRRRMIREAMLLARTTQNDAELRQRLLDYLSEGVGTEHLARLLEQPQVDLEAWWGFVEKVTLPQEGGELRGMCIRALESWPDHPGLLLTRAIAEALCSDHDQAVSTTGIADAIRIGLEKYELGEEELEAAFNRMFDAADNGRPTLAAPLTVALVRLGAGGADIPGLAFASKLVERVYEFGLSELHCLARTEKLRRVAERAEAASGRLKEWLSAPEVVRILEGETDGR